MSDYTPSTAEVRTAYSQSMAYPHMGDDQFHRWFKAELDLAHNIGFAQGYSQGSRDTEYDQIEADNA